MPFYFLHNTQVQNILFNLIKTLTLRRARRHDAPVQSVDVSNEKAFFLLCNHKCPVKSNCARLLNRVDLDKTQINTGAEISGTCV